jgi:hypothetical protein
LGHPAIPKLGGITPISINKKTSGRIGIITPLLIKEARRPLLRPIRHYSHLPLGREISVQAFSRIKSLINSHRTKRLPAPTTLPIR